MIAVLLGLGAALELGGIALVGWDVYDARRTLRNLSNREWLAEHGQIPDLIGLAVAAGSIRRRAVGVGLFASGLIVQTVANIAAL